MIGDINHDVDVQDVETIVGIREESDYRKCFIYIIRFIGMFERECYGSEQDKKDINWQTEIYEYETNDNCKINTQVIMNTSQDIGGVFNSMCLL